MVEGWQSSSLYFVFVFIFIFSNVRVRIGQQVCEALRELDSDELHIQLQSGMARNLAATK